MPPKPTDESSRLAASKNAAALRLFDDGRLRQALDALNQAITIAPSYPHSFANRARVFERLGLKPQAAADRRRARDLAAAAGLSEQELFEAPLPAMPPPRRPPPRPAPSRPSPPARPLPPPVGAARPRPGPQVSLPRLSMDADTFFVLAAIAGVAAIVAAIVFIARASPDLTPGLDFNAFDAGTPLPTASPPAATASAPSPTPTALPPGAGSGSPISLSDLQRAWNREDITAKVGGPSEGFSGFSVTPVTFSLAGEEGSAQLSVFVYPNPEQAQQDWDLPQGNRPAPNSGRSLPSHQTIWWNANVIVVVRFASEEVSEQAMDAFLNL